MRTRERQKELAIFLAKLGACSRYRVYARKRFVTLQDVFFSKDRWWPSSMTSRERREWILYRLFEPNCLNNLFAGHRGDAVTLTEDVIDLLSHLPARLVWPAVDKQLKKLNAWEIL